MEDLESKISQILSDPSALSNIMSMAKGLGLTPPATASQPDADEPEIPPPRSNEADPPTDDLPFSVVKFLSEAGNLDGKQAALFNALKPFLKPDRREKIDRAVKAARISHMAGYAIKNLGKNQESR